MDTVSNMIIKLKNAGDARHESVSMPFSNLKRSIAEVLKKEGFITNFGEKSEKGKRILVIATSKVSGVKRISKPSKRIYKKATEIRPVKNGYGALILSTSRGVMTGREAKRAKLGGEALFNIW
ncbi:MAG: 30S ribosomal protein S8 [Candidatus Zambryskibacteria bacterium]|nr:30S ribosomal protein S8 [Candidatus Zambryskibacteria bacterium]